MLSHGTGYAGTICYERAEPLCNSLNHPRLLYVALLGRWRCSLHTNKMSAAMQIAERVYSLAQEQNDSALMLGAYRALAATLYFLGDFESARQDAMYALQIWSSGDVQYQVEEVFRARSYLSVLFSAMRVASRRDRLFPRDDGRSDLTSEGIE